MNTKRLGWHKATSGLTVALTAGLATVLACGAALAQSKTSANSPTSAPNLPTLSSPLGKAEPSTLQNATFTNAPQGSFSSRVNAAAGVAPAGPSANATAKPGSGAGSGSGAGLHGAGSPFAPLVDKAGVVSWSVLTELKTKTEKNRILPVFNASQMALNQKTQKLQGFMMPLEPGEKQKHFLLTSVPMSCGFCVPGGPESMVEVRTKTPIKYTMDAVVVEGKFTVLSDDPYGLYYRVTDAVSVQ